MKITDVIKKDLKIILSDRKAISIMIMMPIILMTILSFALSGTFVDGGTISKVRIALVKNYDKKNDLKRFRYILQNSIMAQNIYDSQLEEMINSAEELDIEAIFIDEFLNNENLKEIIDYKIVNEEAAMKLLKNRKISAVVILPENFIYDMSINFLTPFRNKVNIKVIGDPDKYIRVQIVEEIMKAFSDMTSSMIIGKNVFIETILEEEIGFIALEDIESVFKEMKGFGTEIGVNIDYIKVDGKEPISSFEYYSVGMTTMFILFAASYGSKSLLEEKDNNTYQRMIMAGTSKWKIAAGKFFTIFTFALMQIITMVIYSSLVLGVNWGNLALIALISICTVFSVAGIGTMIAAATYRIENYKMANVFDTVIIQAMALLGGSFFPINILPGFLQKLSIISVNGLALKSFLKVMRGYGIGEIQTYLLILIGMGVIFTVVAVYILSREGGHRNVKHNKAETLKTA